MKGVFEFHEAVGFFDECFFFFQEFGFGFGKVNGFGTGGLGEQLVLAKGLEVSGEALNIGEHILEFERDSVFIEQADERISGFDVEVDIGQGFEVAFLVDGGNEFEEEPQFADFDGFFDEVDAVKIIEDNGFENEVVFAFVVGDGGEFVLNIGGEFFAFRRKRREVKFGDGVRSRSSVSV